MTGSDLDRRALEAEADRLSGVYLKVAMLARARRIGFDAAGRDAAEKGLIAAADWDVVREAVDGR